MACGRELDEPPQMLTGPNVLKYSWKASQRTRRKNLDCSDEAHTEATVKLHKMRPP